MEIILTTPERLGEIVREAVKKSLPESPVTTPQKSADTCSLEQALAFLSENGYRMSKSRLYKMTADKKVPFRYFGRKIVFSKSELLHWVEQQTKPSSDATQIVMSLARSARRKSSSYKSARK